MGRVSRNIIPQVLLFWRHVAPRMGRVSRNIYAASHGGTAKVAPRMGRVSRNDVWHLGDEYSKRRASQEACE